MGDRFYINSPVVQDQVLLQGAEAHHLAAVSRKKPNDPVILFTGDGWEYQARIVHADRRTVALEVVDREYRPRMPAVDLVAAVSLPKGDRAQFLVEKLTEIGVCKFIPLQAQRSIIPAAKVNREKLQRWMVEACKQCGRNRLMEIAPPVTAGELFSSTTVGFLRLITRHDGRPVPDLLARTNTSLVMFAIGPEGGWTTEELTIAEANHWIPVTLGERTLRVETAALALAGYIVMRMGGGR